VTRRRLVAAGLGSLALAGGAALVTSPASAATTDSQTWSTPGSYDFVVPAGVTWVTIEAKGAGGGAAGGLTDPDALGGNGGEIEGEFATTPGETLKVFVGERGRNGDDDGAGGLNGGGDGGQTSCAQISWGGGGGGASDVRQGGATLADRIVVAGGGGGGGSADGIAGAYGGGGGGANPTDGADNGNGTATVAGGDAPVGANGGVRGTGGSDPNEIAGADGTLGSGGAGAGTTMCGGGGGGGGGYYGGGGGAASGGGVGSGPVAMGAAGGGGSSFWLQPGNTLSSIVDGVNSGDGEVTISWIVPPSTTTSPTTTTVPPTSEPEFECPSPVPALRVFPNVFSVKVAAFMIDHCGSTARGTTAAGQPVVVLDPPVGSTCPSWQAMQVYRTELHLKLAKHLLDNCRYSVKAIGGNVYVVPSGYPA
jgi:hypothetical protein